MIRDIKLPKGMMRRILYSFQRHGFRNYRSIHITHVNNSDLFDLGKSGTSIYLLKESAKV